MSNIPIFLASDNNYAPFVATTICSIVKNTKSFVDFYILDGGISLFNKYKIKFMKEQFQNFSVHYYDMDSFSLDRFPNIAHYSLNTFSRYFIPELNIELSKILYIDVDVIIKGDIAELYNQSLESYPIAAVLEDFYPGNYTHLKKIYDTYKGESNYFNAGVLLIDLDYFRKNKVSEKLINMTIELKDVLSCPDQDIFNIIFDGNFKVLDYKYNFMPDHFGIFKDKYPAMADNVKDNALVIHYTAGKPWHNNSIASNDFWDIAKLTYFYDDIVAKLNNYDLMNKFYDQNYRLEDTNRKLEDTNRKLEDTNRKLEDTNRKLEDTNRKLEDTNRKLEDTNRKLEDTDVRLEETRYNINWIKIFGIYNNKNYIKIVLFGLSFTFRMNEYEINKIAWWIPVKKWRDNFRNKF